MASTSEATIGKNVANLGFLITCYTNMGTAYNPGKANLRLPALVALKTEAEAAHMALGEQKIAYQRVVAGRAATYQPLGKLVTRCLNNFLTSDALQQVKDRAKAMADKLRGVGRSTPQPPVEPDQTQEERKHSTMQRSFVMRAENFGLFIEMLRAEPTYLPGKDDIKVNALAILHTTMKSENLKADEAFVLWKNKQADRDHLFYEDRTGLVDVALDTKKYIVGDFGTNSPEYLAVKGVKFNRKR